MLLHEILILADRLAPVLLLPVMLWTVVVLAAARRPGADWLGAVTLALVAAALAGLLALLAMPGGTFVLAGEPVPGGFGATAARLAALAIGFGLAAGAMAWPLAAMRTSR